MRVHAGYAGLGAAGAALVLAAALGVASRADDPAMRALVAWIAPTNPYYDGLRVWISAAVLGLFLIWLARELALSYPQPAMLPPFRWHPHFVLGLAVFPLFWVGHHGLLGVPDWLWAEDGPMEYLTVALVLGAAALAIAAARRGHALTHAERVLLAVFAGGLVFLAGEEISWGQRLLDLETPAALSAHNVQGEINLHNLTVGWNEVVRMIAACLISAALVLEAADRLPGLRGRLDGLRPDDRFFWLPLLLIPASLYDELFEQVVSYALFAYALLVARRVRDFGRPVT